MSKPHGCYYSSRKDIFSAKGREVAIRSISSAMENVPALKDRWWDLSSEFIN